MFDNNIIITISIVIAVLAFVALVAFLACTLIFLMRSLKRTEQLIAHSNGIAADIEKKLHAFDPLFVQIHQLGKFVEKKTESIKKHSESISDKIIVEEHDTRVEAIAGVAELCEWALIGFGLARRFLKKRK